MSILENTTSASRNISKLHKDNLQVISLVAMLGGWALLLAYGTGYLITKDARFTSLVLLEIAFGIALTVAWLFQWRGHHHTSTVILFTSVFTAIFGFNFIVSGLGLTVGVLLTVIFSVIAWQILPARSAIIANVMTILGGILVYMADTSLAQGDRIAGGFFLAALLIVVGGIVLFILIINGLRGIEFASINNQIRVAFFVTSLIPIFIIAIFQIVSMYNFFATEANNNLQSNANDFARDLDSLLFSYTKNIDEDALRSEVINYFKKPNADTTLLAGLASRYSGVISYGFLDKDGYLLLDNGGSSGRDESKNAYFTNAASVRITYLSDMLVDESTGKRVFYASTPVLDEQGSLLGIIRIKFSNQVFQTLATDLGREIREATQADETSSIVSTLMAIFSTETGETETGINLIIIDEANIILAHSTLPELQGSMLTHPGAKTLNDLQQAGRLPTVPNILGLDELANILRTAASEQVFSSAIYPDDPDEDLVTFSSAQLKPWKVLAAQDTTTFLAPILNQIFTIILIILVLVVAVYFGASLTASLLVTPINTLASAAKVLGEGNLEQPIDLPRKDELGVLSSVLNTTRQQVRELLLTLEERVAERTSELATVNEKNRRRAEQLETIAQVAHSVASLRDPRELLPEITRQISASFGYYHTGIFLVDENAEYAVLRAANSEGGQRMLLRGHRLKVGHEGIVGNVTNTGLPRVALDVGDDAVFFNNPDLPKTRSEAALPLHVGEKIIGALDVQSIEPNAFSDEDIKSLSLLSDQISVAIENARLFDETRAALAQIQQIYTETSVSGWQSMVSESSTSGFRYARGSIEPLHSKFEPTTSRTGEILELPIVLRNEKLGALKIRRPSSRTAWTEAEVRMYQSIVERMSFALENARLFSDARRRANLERLASEATTKISASARFETILRTAAEEISHLLDGSEVLVQIQPDIIEKMDR